MYDLTLIDAKFVNSKFLKYIQLILNNSHSDLVELQFIPPFTNSQSTENYTADEPHN